MVAAQLAELPTLPHQPQGLSLRPVPETILFATNELSATTLRNLPQLSEDFAKIIHCLHQVAISSALSSPDTKIDDYIVEPMYDAERLLLKVLAAQKLPDHGFTDVEILLAETFQLYFWTGTRGLPPQTRLCELFISRVMKALLPLMLEASSDLLFVTGPRMAAAAEKNKDSTQTKEQTEDRFYRFLRHTREANNIITWALALGTLITAPLLAPEHHWFKDHFQLQLRAMALHQDYDRWLAFLSLFPTTDGFTKISWIDLRTVWRDYGV